MTRAEIRKQIFILIYQSSFYKGDDLEEEINTYLEKNEFSSDEEIKEKFWLAYGYFDEIDEVINKYSNGWKTSRMSKVDLSILRLAIYEITYDNEVPKAVAINEAVNLAKKYGGNKSSSFINGILSKI